MFASSIQDNKQKVSRFLPSIFCVLLQLRYQFSARSLSIGRIIM